MKKTPAPFVTVERLWPNSTVVCLGSGPSLSPDDVEFCHGRARVIAVNDTYTLAPWADALYAADDSWWRAQKGAPTFAGLKFTIEPQLVNWPGIGVLRNCGPKGLETNPAGLRTGKNSGYQAINLAVHLGASTIILLGYDMQGGHFYDRHATKRTDPKFAEWIALFKTLVEPLTQAGVTIVNATRSTALTCFPCVSLEHALAEAA